MTTEPKPKTPAEMLYQATKRVNKILKSAQYPRFKVDVAVDLVHPQQFLHSLCIEFLDNIAVDPLLFQEPAENELFVAVNNAQMNMLSLNYLDRLVLLSTLADPVNQFLQSVRIMADDEAVKNNRLNLLLITFTTLTSVANMQIAFDGVGDQTDCKPPPPKYDFNWFSYILLSARQAKAK